jgi:hypothetical protein
VCRYLRKGPLRVSQRLLRRDKVALALVGPDVEEGALLEVLAG